MYVSKNLCMYVCLKVSILYVYWNVCILYTVCMYASVCVNLCMYVCMYTAFMCEYMYIMYIWMMNLYFQNSNLSINNVRVKKYIVYLQKC